MEISVALTLLIGLRIGLIAAMALLVVFTVALLRMWRMGISQDCGCFGEHSDAATPLGHGRNTLLFVAALGAAAAGQELAAWHHDPELAITHVAVVGAAGALWVLLQTFIARHRLLLKGEAG